MSQPSVTMNPPEPLQKLHDLDRTSPQFYQEISEFIRGKDYRDAVPNLKGEGLVWLVEYLDGVIVGISDPAGPAFQSLRELRRICGVKEVLPSSCILSDSLSDVAPSPTSEYVHVGTLNGSRVRIRRTGAYSKRGSRKVMKAFYQIAVVWRHLSHPNILPLLGVTTNPLQLVSDSMSGVTLPEYIAGNPGADRRSLLSDTAAGLNYLHFYGLVHGDLAGSNIIVDVAGRAKVTDFGVTMITQNLDLTQSTPAEVGHGARWIAPEILDGRSTYSKEGDVFSFAMVAIEAFTGAIPFNDKPPRAAMLAIMGGKRPLRPTDPTLTDELWALIQQCWDQETRQRPPALQILRGFRIPAWKRLIDPSLDPKERVSLIEATFSDREELEAVRRLCGDEAQSFIDRADEVLDSLERRLRRKCLKLLCKICGSQALLPRSIQVSIRCDRSGAPLYRGGYADVWEGECKGLRVAVKVLRVYSKSDFDQVIHKFCMEVMTWKTLCHPNVLPLLGVSMHNYNFSMASEWMENRNIIEFIKAHRDANRFKLLKDVTQGLMYMHSEEMVHGDLKGANILINTNGDAVLADFGLLTIVSDSTYSSTSGSFASAGTTRWMSPELLDPEPFGCKSDQPTEKSDCYALGITILEVLSGKLPFHYYKDLTVMQKILDCEQPERPTGPEGLWFTDDLWEMLRLCWSPKPNDRPSIELVLGKLEHGLITWVPPPPNLEDPHADLNNDSYSTVTSIMGQTTRQHGARFPHDEAPQSLTDCWSDDFQGDDSSDGDGSADSTATIHASAPRTVEPLPIPQRQYGQLHYESYRTQFGLETPIMFPSCSGQKGILLGDAINEDIHDLVGGDEPVFAGYTCPAISLRILWPGYVFWIKTVEIRDWRSGQKRINKAQLAIEVAKKVHQFTQEMTNVAIEPGSEEWRVGPGSIETNNLVLVSLVNVTEGSWQPELRLLPKPPSEEARDVC